MAKKITSKQLPKDFAMESATGHHATFRLSGTITTTHEADAVMELIRIIYGMLSSHREMVAADIGVEEKPLSYVDRLRAAGIICDGEPAQAIEAGTVETEGLRAEPDSAVGETDAPKEPIPPFLGTAGGEIEVKP